MTTNFDRWTDDGVRFVFGYDAIKSIICEAEEHPIEMYQELRRAEREEEVKERKKPENVKKRIVREREFSFRQIGLSKTGSKCWEIQHRSRYYSTGYCTTGTSSSAGPKATEPRDSRN